MNLEKYQNDLCESVPVVAFERNIADIWKAGSISDNNKKYGILAGIPGQETDILSQIYSDDQDLVSRKLGAAILQKKTAVDLRYRIQTEIYYRWVEEHCSLSYSNTGDLEKANSYIWISPLATEWALLTKGSEIWNALNSKIRHDVLNQLTAILGYLELSSDVISDPMLIDFAKREQNAAEKIRDRLIFTREYQKIGLLEFSWILLSDIIQESLNEIPLGSIKITIQTQNAFIFTDKNFRLALEKILANIPEHGAGVTEIIIQMQSTDAGGLLSITDNGCGIPDKKKDRIFELGFGEGNGDGLFLAERILTVFGITIRENGIYEQGARFELEIPSIILKNCS